MPPKQVICNVCKMEVMKSQTYAVGGNDEKGDPLRACKVHEGVVEKSKELQKKERRLKKAKKKQEESKNQRRPRQELGDVLKEGSELTEWAWTHCWCCEREGIHLKEFYRLQLIAMEKDKLKGKFELFAPKTTTDLMKQIGAQCVMHRFELDEELFKKYTAWKNRIHHKCRMDIEFVHIIQLCFDCQRRTGIMYDLEANMPKVSLEDMAVMGAMYEDSDWHETIKAIAESSIAKDNHDTAQSN